MKINAIGKWIILGILVTGAVVCACMGKEKEAEGIGTVAIVAFFLLD